MSAGGVASSRCGVRATALIASVFVVSLAACTTTQREANPANIVRDTNTTPVDVDNQKRAQARMDLASAYFGRGQVATALEQVKIAIAADPNYGQAYNLRGLIYANQGEPALAEESFRRALAIDPRDGDAMHNFGYFLCQQKRYPESYAQFAQAIAEPRYRGASRTLFAQGVCQTFAGQLPEADASLSRAYDLDPLNPYVATTLAEVLYKRGEHERARFYVRRVNAMPDVTNAQTLWLAARIENRLNNRQGTDDFGRQLQRRFPESREASAFARGAFDE